MRPAKATIEFVPASQEDEEVVRVLDAYLAGLERGISLEPDLLLAQHPAIAHRLRSCLVGLDLLASQAQNGASKTIEIGDYLIEHEIGRGGMGVVYQVVQRTTGHRVALKILPFAASLDPRQLQRFKNEAHAASHLEHPHIVPVYDVGCAAGIHYYTMRLVAGMSLSSVWHKQRQAAGKTEPKPANDERLDTAAIFTDHTRAGP